MEVNKLVEASMKADESFYGNTTNFHESFHLLPRKLLYFLEASTDLHGSIHIFRWKVNLLPWNLDLLPWKLPPTPMETTMKVNSETKYRGKPGAGRPMPFAHGS